MRKAGIYVHIPFCRQKCRYCDFYSLSCSEKTVDYVLALCSHIGMESKNRKDVLIDTVFIGGGTPSLLNIEQSEMILKTLRDNFSLTQDCEITIEANPGTLTKEKLLSYRKSGINRLSIGLQSVNDSELKMLGRIHDFDTFEKNFTIARECGFDNISVDVMYALPNQKTKDFIKTLDTVCAFSPEHISAYCLKIEPNTEFYKIKDTLNLPSEDEQYDMYISACKFLEEKGYKQYEISNFSKTNASSRHNLRYWLSEDYIGFGPSAHSFVNGERYFYKDSLDEYIETIKNGKTPNKIFEASHVLSENEKEDEYVMLRMRLSYGVSEKDFFERYKKDFVKRYPKIEKYVKTGHILNENGRYHFTPQGFFVSNYILSDILDFI